VSFADLDAGLRRLLGTGRFEAVIHAAAVSDYGVDSIVSAGGVVPAGVGKIESGHAPLLRLRLHPKLVDGLRGLSPTPLQVVAFKLTHGADEATASEAVRKLFEHSGADYVVHNDLTARRDAGSFPATVHGADGTTEHCPTRAVLATALEQILTRAPAPIINHKS
jgi:phosphopantothenoylcysteine decarboxylase/phosphopantothenate--cysteine ligase